MAPRGVVNAAGRRRLAQNLDPTTAREIMAAVTPRAAIEALVRDGDEPPPPPELVRSKKKGRGEAFGDLDLAQSILSAADVSEDELRTAALEALARADEKKYCMISPTSYLRVPIEGRRPIDDVRRILPQLSETDLRTIAGDMKARANAKAAAAGEA